MSTTYIVTGQDTGQPRIDYTGTLTGLKPGDTFTTTLDGALEAKLLGAGLIAKTPLPAMVTSAGTPDASGKVLTSTAAGLNEGEWLPSSGGSGVSIPLVLDGAASTDPVLELGVTGESDPRLIVNADGSTVYPGGMTFAPDPVNEMAGAMAYFAGNVSVGTIISLYGSYTHPDGTIDQPSASFVYMEARPSLADLFVGNWQASGGVDIHATGVDDLANSYYGTVTIYRDSAAPNSDRGGFATVDRALGDGNHPTFTIDFAGVLGWSDGTTAPDTTLRRDSAGVLKIAEHGGGIKLTSPDGSQTKQIQLSNAGALVVV